MTTEEQQTRLTQILTSELPAAQSAVSTAEKNLEAARKALESATVTAEIEGRAPQTTTLTKAVSDAEAKTARAKELVAARAKAAVLLKAEIDYKQGEIIAAQREQLRAICKPKLAKIDRLFAELAAESYELFLAGQTSPIWGAGLDLTGFLNLLFTPKSAADPGADQLKRQIKAQMLYDLAQDHAKTAPAALRIEKAG